MSDQPFPADSLLVAACIASPNHDARPDEGQPDILLLHYTGMPTADGALARLTDAASKVSAHYLVDEGGHVTQMVPEARRAWHAGLSSWEGETDINARSIGIEIVNPGHEHGYHAFPAQQIEAVTRLARDICDRHALRPERVLAHSDVAPRRKTDPGELFPWQQLAEQGVGIWVEPAPITGGRFLSEGDQGEPVEALQAMLALYGYGIDITGRFDAATSAVVAAFQRHFRPARIDGVADVSTVTTLRNLLASIRD